MKKIILSTALFAMIALLAGCLTTLHPIFTGKDLITDVRLIGNWEKTKDRTTVSYRNPVVAEISRLSPALRNYSDKIYMLEEKNKDGTIKSSYYAFMVKLGKYYYMDYYPAGEKEEKLADNFFSAHYVAMHSIYRLRFMDNNSFNIQQLDAGYLQKLIENKQIRLKHEIMEDGDCIITAPTEELQQYLIKYSDVSAAYSKDRNEDYTRTK
jgi:hypothetical protein